MMKIRLSFLLALLSTLAFPIAGQKGFYAGTEFANKRDYYSFVNSAGSSADHGILTNLYGGYVGYQHSRLSFETGLYQFTSMVPEITYDAENDRPFFGKAAHRTDANNTQVIPLRFGYDFPFRKKGFYLNSFIGLMVIYNDIETNSRVVNWIREEEDGNTSTGYVTEGDSIIPFPTGAMFSYGTGYATDRFNLGYQAGISAGYRIKDRIDIYIRLSALGSFNLLYFENVQYNYHDELISGTTGFHGNSTALHLGLRFYLRKEKQLIYGKPV
ncbi:MAG: hypothetical protein JW801_05005 [Bacteroidales bacterium]|nr:hypothetical protein [Bacteroidales bacterium]